MARTDMAAQAFIALTPLLMELRERGTHLGVSMMPPEGEDTGMSFFATSIGSIADAVSEMDRVRTDAAALGYQLDAFLIDRLDVDPDNVHGLAFRLLGTRH